MSSTDPVLGRSISRHLARLGIETPMMSKPFDYAIIKSAQQDIMLNGLGLDMNDDSLLGTPSRVAKMYCQEVFTGLDYSIFPKCTVVENKAKYDEMISVKNADVLSICEHHFVPFIGHAAVAYIPNTKILGLSKINRVVDFFSRRPQIQERLTLQIYAALQHILGTSDIAVVIKAEHLCVRLRGVQQQSETITSKMGGKFMEKPPLREEFLALIR